MGIKTRKNRRKIVGGFKYQNQNNNQQAIEEIEEKIQKQNELPSIEEIPVIGKAVDLAEGVAVNALDKTGELIGVDIDNPGSINQKLTNISNAISNPDNVEKIKEIGKKVGRYGSVLVEASQPFLDKFVDKTLPIVTRGVEKAVNAGTRALTGVAETFAGPFVAFPMTVVDSLRATNAAVNAGSELVEGVSEAVQGTQENFERLTKMPDFNPTINPNYNPNPNYKPDINMPQYGGKTMKNLTRQVKQIGGRIHNAKSEFLSSHINRKQMIKKYTRHNRNRHKKMNRY
jgi:hypothetical protein